MKSKFKKLKKLHLKHCKQEKKNLCNCHCLNYFKHSTSYSKFPDVLPACFITKGRFSFKKENIQGSPLFKASYRKNDRPDGNLMRVISGQARGLFREQFPDPYSLHKHHSLLHRLRMRPCGSVLQNHKHTTKQKGLLTSIQTGVSWQVVLHNFSKST